MASTGLYLEMRMERYGRSTVIITAGAGKNSYPRSYNALFPGKEKRMSIAHSRVHLPSRNMYIRMHTHSEIALGVCKYSLMAEIFQTILRT